MGSLGEIAKALREEARTRRLGGSARYEGLHVQSGEEQAAEAYQDGWADALDYVAKKLLRY